MSETVSIMDGFSSKSVHGFNPYEPKNLLDKLAAQPCDYSCENSCKIKKRRISEAILLLLTYVTQTDHEEKPQFCIKNEVENTNGLFCKRLFFLLTYPRTRLIEVSMTLVACLLSFLDLLLLLWRCLCTRSGPLDLVRIPSRRSLTSSLTRPCLLTLASSAAVLISLVLIGGTSTFGGGGAFKSPCSEKFQIFT